MPRFVAGRKIFKIGMRVRVRSVVSKPITITNVRGKGRYQLRLAQLAVLEGDQIVGVRWMLNLDL